jgi:FeoB-associated Cys-rich membrane protein
MDWQTLTAVGIVGITLVIFLVRILRPKKKSGCGHDCGCGKPNEK